MCSEVSDKFLQLVCFLFIVLPTLLVFIKWRTGGPNHEQPEINVSQKIPLLLANYEHNSMTAEIKGS